MLLAAGTKRQPPTSCLQRNLAMQVSLGRSRFTRHSSFGGTRRGYRADGYGIAVIGAEIG
jgi:hypothetical protein